MENTTSTKIGRGTLVMGAVVLLPALLAPSSSFLNVLAAKLGVYNNFLYVLLAYYPQIGGVIAQIRNLMSLIHYHYPLTEQYIVALAATVLGTAVTTLSVMFFWQRTIERAANPGAKQVLFTVLKAMGSSLALTLVLSVIEFMVCLKIYPYNYTVLAVPMVNIYLMVLDLVGVLVLFLVGLLVIRKPARAMNSLA